MLFTFCMFYWYSSRIQFSVRSIQFKLDKCYVSQRIFLRLVSVAFSFSSNHTHARNPYRYSHSANFVLTPSSENNKDHCVRSNCPLILFGNLSRLHMDIADSISFISILGKATTSFLG